jgi:hypothetical protein
LGQNAIGKQMTRILGGNFPRPSIISSASLVTLCLFYIYSISAYLGLTVYPLVDRVTYYSQFDVYITNEYVDHIIIGSLLTLWIAFSSTKTRISYIAIGIFSVLFAISVVMHNYYVLDGVALSSLPAIAGLVLYNKYSVRRILTGQSLELTQNYFALLGIILGVFGLVFTLFLIFHSNLMFGTPIRNYAYDVFLIFSRLSPILILLLIACIPVKFLTNFVLKNPKFERSFDMLPVKSMEKKKKTFYISLAISLSIVVAIIPHLSAVNPDNQQIGVDTKYYVTWINALESSNSADILSQAFVVQDQGQRPLSLLFVYSLDKITNLAPSVIVEYLPLILGPLLVIVTYFLTRELTSTDLPAIMSSFVTAISFQVLIGVYAGFYANWMALILGYLSFVFLLRFLKKGKIVNLIIYSALILLVLFTHVYTWSILSFVAGIFLLILAAKPRRWPIVSRRNVLLLLLAILLSVVIDTSRAISAGTSSGIEGDLMVASELSGPGQFLLRWNNLTYATTTFVGGQFSNFIILGLGVYWLVKTRIQDLASIFLLIFLSIGILPFLFGDWQIQTRVFYDIPFQIPAAIALAHIRNQTNRVLLAPSYIWLIGISIISAANFYLVLPTK